MTTTKAQRRLAFVSLLLVSAMLIVIAGCANAKVNANQAQLVKDIAKSGLIVGRPLPRGMKLDSTPVSDGQVAGCQNGVLNTNIQGELVTAFVTASEDSYGDRALSVLTVKTGDGQSFFGLPKGTLLKLYGEPSEIKEAKGENGAENLGCKSYDYYYDMGNGNFAMYSLLIPYRKSEDIPSSELNKVMALTCLAFTKDMQSLVMGSNAKIFPWPKGL
jgi:hypothetical protein